MKVRLALAGLIALACWVCVAPALHGGFVFDDVGYVAENPVIAAPDGLARIWRGENTIDYWPLSFSVFWAEKQAFGDSTFGYHAAAAALHAGAAVTFAFLLEALGLSLAASWLGALLFAVHPANAETAAWIFQTRTSLSALLAFAAALAFVRGRARAWVLPSFFFAAALLAKTQPIALPVALALWLWARRAPRAEWLRVLPLFAIAAAAGGWALYAREPVVSDEGFVVRALVSARAFWESVGHTAWPFGLGAVHERWPMSLLSASGWVSFAALAASAALLFWHEARPLPRAGLASLLAALALLAPTLGLIAIPFHAHARVADHWMYLAIAIPCAWFAWSAEQAWKLCARPASRAGAFAVLALALFALARASHQRAETFASPATFWQDTLAKNPGASIAAFNLGALAQKEGDPARSIAFYVEALRLRPSYLKARHNLAIALQVDHRPLEAIEQYRRVLDERPCFCAGRSNLALALATARRLPEAIDEFGIAMRDCPDFADARYKRALAMIEAGRKPEAIVDLRAALAAPPEYWDAEFAAHVVFASQAEAQALLAQLEGSGAH